jgi:Flp pilus assembly protein TadG
MSTGNHRLQQPARPPLGAGRIGLMSLRRRRAQAGAAEVAQFGILALLIALPLLIGIVEISVGFFNQAILTNASRAAAREAIRVPPPPDDTPVVEAAQEAAGGLLNWDNSGGLTADMVDMVSDGERVTVTLTYPHRFILLPSFLDGINDLDLVARTEMRIMTR